MKPYGADRWVDKRSDPPRRARETREAMRHEDKAGTWPEHPEEARYLWCDAGLGCDVCESGGQ